jgi:hypothetical protein
VLNLRQRCRVGVVSFAALVSSCLPAFASNSEPYFSYMLNVLVEGDNGGGIAPVREPLREPRPRVIINQTPYSVVQADCYSTNGDIPSFYIGFDPNMYGITTCEGASSFNLASTLTTQMLGGSSANVVTGSATTISLSMKPSAPGPFLLTAAIGIVNYAQIFEAPPGSTVNFPFSTVGTGNGQVDVTASSDCDGCFVSAGNTGPSMQNLNMGTLTIGPSGQYTITAQLFGSAENPGNVAPVSSITLNFCPMTVTLFGNGTPTIRANALPPASTNLSTAATSCGYQGFNWQQSVTNSPCPDTVVPVATAALNANLCSMVLGISPGMAAGPQGGDAPQFNDPPPGGGYTYLTYADGSPYSPSPYYYPILAGTQENVPLPLLVNGNLVSPIINHGNAALAFVDTPAGPCLPTGPLSATTLAKCGGHAAPENSYMGFTTNFVGVNLSDGSPSPPLFSWTYVSNYNGTVGGIGVFSGFLPPDPGSGVGNVTITSINGVPVPPIIPPAQVRTTASGLAYSRVTKTFNGTVTITNTSGTTLTTPSAFQLVLNSLPAGVTLSNSMGTFNQCPYITIPALTSLVPGQSVTVAVQFSNPSDALIDFTPEFYAGSFQ